MILCCNRLSIFFVWFLKTIVRREKIITLIDIFSMKFWEEKKTTLTQTQSKKNLDNNSLIQNIKLINSQMLDILKRREKERKMEEVKNI